MSVLSSRRISSSGLEHNFAHGLLPFALTTIVGLRYAALFAPRVAPLLGRGLLSVLAPELQADCRRRNKCVGRGFKLTAERADEPLGRQFCRGYGAVLRVRAARRLKF